MQLLTADDDWIRMKGGWFISADSSTLCQHTSCPLRLQPGRWQHPLQQQLKRDSVVMSPLQHCVTQAHMRMRRKCSAYACSPLPTPEQDSLQQCAASSQWGKKKKNSIPSNMPNSASQIYKAALGCSWSCRCKLYVNSLITIIARLANQHAN